MRVDDDVVIGQQPVREKALLEIEPEALGRVQFGRVGRQRVQSNVGRNGEGIRAMPARLIERHHCMFVISNGFGKAVEESLHCRPIGIRHHQREGLIRAWLNGGEDIAKVKRLLHSPSGRSPRLHQTDAALLADARRILKEEAQALIFVRALNFFEERRSPF